MVDFAGRGLISGTHQRASRCKMMLRSSGLSLSSACRSMRTFGTSVHPALRISFVHFLRLVAMGARWGFSSSYIQESSAWATAILVTYQKQHVMYRWTLVSIDWVNQAFFGERLVDGALIERRS